MRNYFEIYLGPVPLYYLIADQLNSGKLFEITTENLRQRLNNLLLNNADWATAVRELNVKDYEIIPETIMSEPLPPELQLPTLEPTVERGIPGPLPPPLGDPLPPGPYNKPPKPPHPPGEPGPYNRPREEGDEEFEDAEEGEEESDDEEMPPLEPVPPPPPPPPEDEEGEEEERERDDETDSSSDRGDGGDGDGASGSVQQFNIATPTAGEDEAPPSFTHYPICER